MRVVYFSSDTHPFEKAIYPGVGPAFARPLGWPTAPLTTISETPHDIAVVDNRLEEADLTLLDSYLRRPATQRPPLLFRISDPDMPDSTNPNVRFIFACADRPGVHYATTYEPAGPFLAFVSSLRHSAVLPLPFAYDSSREVDTHLGGRSRRLFLSGAHNRRLYPVRYALRRQKRWNPLLKALIFDLKHPGYPEFGQVLHHVTHDRFVALAPRYTHFSCAAPGIEAS